MPTYEYRCNNCDERSEIFQSIKDNPKRKCPSCGKNTLERLISGGGAILFKGSGFYETDYRSETYKKAAEADKKASSGDADSKSDSKSNNKSESKSGDKSDSKPEKKTETKAEKPSGKDAKKPDPKTGASAKSS